MGNRRKRSRREDPRSMTWEQFIEDRVRRYLAERRRVEARYLEREQTSPYTAIERLRYG